MSEITFVTVSKIGSDAPHQGMAGIWLASRGWDITVICPANTEARKISTELGEICVDPIAKPGRRTIHWHLFWKMLRHRFAGTKLFYIQGNPACVAAYLALWGMSSSRIIYHTQDLLDPRKYRVMEFFERSIARRAGRVISNEPARARFLASYYGLAKTPIVVRTALPRDWPDISPPPQARQALLSRFAIDAEKSRLDARVIAAGGPFSDVRCSRELILALSHLPANYLLIFTGMTPEYGTWKEAHSIAASAGVKDRVRFLPKLEFRELLEQFAVCDMGMLLYPDNSFGNYFQQPGRLTEYMRAGIPMITSNFMGLENLVSAYQLGGVADPESPECIAKAIASLGERSQTARDNERVRLRELAGTDFAFEYHAWKIEKELTGILKADMESRNGNKP